MTTFGIVMLATSWSLIIILTTATLYRVLRPGGTQHSGSASGG